MERKQSEATSDLRNELREELPSGQQAGQQTTKLQAGQQTKQPSEQPAGQQAGQSAEWAEELRRLEYTIDLAKEQLEQARSDNEKNMETIMEAKREMRENAVHSVSGLGSSDGFEDLVALSQYVNPIMSKFEEYEATETRIGKLEQLIQSPYFARIDFKFEGEEVFEQVYIGRSSLMKNEFCEFAVYDWRSPIASVFYRFLTGPAYYEAPAGRIDGEVSLKRQYEIHGGTLEYFFDAEVQIVDEFLRKLLSQNTSSKMKTIVETIQREQDIVIRDMDTELMMVQGVAGSGKTSIALHRTAYLMYQGLSSKLSANNIIIISPNTLFEQYISNVLPELGEENVVSVVFETILGRLLRGRHIETRNQFLEKLLTDSPHRELRKQSVEFKTSLLFWELLDRFIADLPHSRIDFQDVYYQGRRVLTSEQLKRKTAVGREKTPLALKLEQLADFILETVKENASEDNNARDIDPAELVRIKEEIQAFTVLDAETLYRGLFRDKDYLFGLARDLPLPSCIGDIISYTQENLDSGTLYYDDAIAIAYLKLRLEGTDEYKNIKQVVIDEAQDYYPLQFELFHLLFPRAKYTVLGDINQTLEKQEDLTLYELIGSLLNRKKSSLVTLDKSFRCTNEILRYSSKFLPRAMEVQSFNRDGAEPEVHTAADRGALCGLIVSEAELCRELGYESIGLICKSERNAAALYQSLKKQMKVQPVGNESAIDLKGSFIIPVYMSKGLEFDAVLVCDADSANYQSEDDKKLLYIACTRALHRLNLFCEGEASPLLV